MLMDATVTDSMDREKIVELLRLLSTELTELADAVEISDTDEHVRELWDDTSETMNSVFAVMASDEEFDASMEKLVDKEISEHPQLSREEAEEIVLQHMDGGDEDDDDEEDDEGDEDESETKDDNL